MPKFITAEIYNPQLDLGKDYLEQLNKAAIELEFAKNELVDGKTKILAKLEALINKFVQQFENHPLINTRIYLYNVSYNYSKTDDHPLYAAITRFTKEKNLTPAETLEVLTDCVNSYLTNFYRDYHFGNESIKLSAMTTINKANRAGNVLNEAFKGYIIEIKELDTQLQLLEQKVRQCEQNNSQQNLIDMAKIELKQALVQAIESIINDAEQVANNSNSESEKTEARGIRGVCNDLRSISNRQNINCITLHTILSEYNTLRHLKENREINKGYGCKKYKQIIGILEAHEKNLLSVNSPNFCENLIKELQQEITEVENNVIEIIPQENNVSQDDEAEREVLINNITEQVIVINNIEQETKNTQQPNKPATPLSFFQRFSLAAANYTSQLIKQAITVPVLNEKEATEALKIILQTHIKQRAQETVESDTNQTSSQEDDLVIINTPQVQIKEYTGFILFQKYQVSFSDKQKACEALQSALDGNPGELVNHLRALENGTLSKKLNEFIKNGYADAIVGIKVTSIKQFVTLLEEKNNILNNQSQQGINTL